MSPNVTSENNGGDEKDREDLKDPRLMWLHKSTGGWQRDAGLVVWIQALASAPHRSSHATVLNELNILYMFCNNMDWRVYCKYKLIVITVYIPSIFQKLI